MTYQNSIAALIAFMGVSSVSSVSVADSIQNALGASKHAIQAVTMGIVASGQATLGVLAVPMMSVGAVDGAISAAITAAGQGSAEGLPINGPLPITDKTIPVTSPADALKPNTTAAQR